ncbi:MAG: saccharopine dehydrogenase family protein [Acidobacteriota bacterium]
MSDRAVVLGAGMMGSAIALELASDCRVKAVDSNAERLKRLHQGGSLQTEIADLSSSEAVRRVVSNCDLVIGAVPGFLGYKVLTEVIEAGKNVVDISFFPEEPFALDEQARRRGVTAVVDCGLAPGLCNMMLGYTCSYALVQSYLCYVGGLPLARSSPFEYKAPFSPRDVIEEYTRPARMIEDGKLISKPALSEVEFLEISGIGTLEAFNTDGLRTLLRTQKIPRMTEKTLRYPGHAKGMQGLREAGFFDTTPIDIKKNSVRPIDLSTELLSRSWRLEAGEPEFTILIVQMQVRNLAGHDEQLEYRLWAEYDPQSRLSSMARTTGFTCAAVARLLLEGRFRRAGIVAPEELGAAPGILNYVLAFLKRARVKITGPSPQA